MKHISEQVKGKKVPQIANQEVCLFGENEAGQQVPEYLDEMFNYDIIRGIGVVVVPKGNVVNTEIN